MKDNVNNNDEIEQASQTLAQNEPLSDKINKDTTEESDLDPKDELSNKKEDTRSKVAILFVLGFFAIIFMCFAFAIMGNASLADLKDTLVGVIGALSGMLGFIVGYYYKSTLE